jgi:hypothetical protein
MYVVHSIASLEPRRHQQVRVHDSRFAPIGWKVYSEAWDTAVGSDVDFTGWANQWMPGKIIWCQLLSRLSNLANNRIQERIYILMIFVIEHYPEKELVNDHPYN